MKRLSLKKTASAIQILAGELTNLRSEMNNGLTCVVSIHGNLSKTIDEAFNKLDENIAKYNDFVDVMYELRAKVSVANNKNGIDKILNQIAETEAKLSVMQLVSKTNQVDLEMTRKQIISTVNRVERDTGGYISEEFRVSCVTKETIDKATKEVLRLKRNKRELQDELLLKNISSTIELSEEAEKILKDLAFI